MAPAAGGTADDREEEEGERVGLLAGHTAGRGGEGAPRSGAVGQRDAAAAEDGLCGRLAAAWRRPLGPRCPAPGWLKRRVVCTEHEEAGLAQLRHLAAAAYDAGEPLHERELRRFFAAARSPAEARELPRGKDARWKELGFQGEDPRTDFRGGGFLALQNMCYLAESFPEQTVQMLREAAPSSSRASMSPGEYLFAAACINISAMLVLLLGLNTAPSMSPVRSMPCPVHAVARKNFARFLCVGSERGLEAGNSAAPIAKEVLGELFASAVCKLHAEWKAVCRRKPQATLLDFGEALGGTAVALERILGGLPAPAAAAVGGGSLAAVALAPQRAAFTAIDFIDAAGWSTGCWNRLAQWRSGALEGACRLAALLAQLLQELGLPKTWAWQHMAEV